jgi:hypothetical protein
MIILAAILSLASCNGTPDVSPAPGGEETPGNGTENGGSAYDGTGPKLTVYEGPSTMTSSSTASIWANGIELFVYDVMVNHEHIWNANTIPSDTPMTYFDFAGEVIIEIEMPGLPVPVESAVVLPSSHGITPRVENGRVTFAITEPGFYTVVYNDHVNKATHIFANPPETDIPDKDDPNVFFIGPGHWTKDAILLTSDQTLYISGGAVLNSVVIADRAVNVTIRGRGIICGADFAGHNQPGAYPRVPIDLRDVKNANVEGIILINSNAWVFNSYMSENVNVDNVKIISARQNGDGFTFQSCRDHTVRNSFARTWDDTLVIKNYAGNTSNILFENVQVWTDLAQSMEIGYETNKGLFINPVIGDVTFRDITVLYNNHKPVISIHNGDDALVQNILFENIMVENAFMRGDHGVNDELIEFHMIKTHWSAVRDEWGSIRDIVIDGLTVLRTLDGRVPPSRILGHNEDHTVENVTIRNVSILGERITTMEALNMELNEYTANIVIEDGGSPLPEPVMPPPFTVPGTIPAPDVTVVRTPVQAEAEMPPGFPDPYENWIKLPEGSDLAHGKAVISGEHTETFAASNVTDGDLTSYWESRGVPMEITIDLADEYTIQTVAVRLNPAPVWEPRTQTFEVLVSTDGENFDVVSPLDRHEFNADTGNIVRIDFDAVAAKYVRLNFTDKSSGRSHGAQAALIQVFE